MYNSVIYLSHSLVSTISVFLMKQINVWPPFSICILIDNYATNTLLHLTMTKNLCIFHKNTYKLMAFKVIPAEQNISYRTSKYTKIIYLINENLIWFISDCTVRAVYIWKHYATIFWWTHKQVYRRNSWDLSPPPPEPKDRIRGCRSHFKVKLSNCAR